MSKCKVKLSPAITPTSFLSLSNPLLPSPLLGAQCFYSVMEGGELSPLKRTFQNIPSSSSVTSQNQIPSLVVSELSENMF